MTIVTVIVIVCLTKHPDKPTVAHLWGVSLGLTYKHVTTIVKISRKQMCSEMSSGVG